MEQQPKLNTETRPENTQDIEDLQLPTEYAELTNGGTAELGREEGQFWGNLFTTTPAAR